MISLEQVQLLESRVSKAVDYVKRLTAENAALVTEKTGLQEKLEVYQKRIDELEVLVMRFKEEQSRIEDGIIAALDRLSQFEEAFENSLKDTPAANKVFSMNQTTAKKPAVKNSGTDTQPVSKEIFFEIHAEENAAVSGSAEADQIAKDSLSTELPADGELDIF